MGMVKRFRPLDGESISKRGLWACAVDPDGSPGFRPLDGESISKRGEFLI